ncbi:MAG: flippase-like domain-containing protein [Thermodesulfovibrionia bacterium]|nr:flippase-like domain-containing protein [Thermodesulfovibrionia bacterium]
MKKILSLVLKLLISGILLIYLFYFSGIVNLQEVVKTLKQTRLSIFIVVYLICLSTVFISTKRWSLFLPGKTKYSRLVSLNFIGFFFNAFLPGRVGGEIARTFYVYKDIGNGSMSIASVFLDKYMGLSAIIGISLITVIGGYSYFKGTEIVWLIPVICSIFLIASFMFWRINWGKIKGISAFYTSLMEYKTKKRIVYYGLILSVIVQVISIIEVYLLSIAIGLVVPIIYFFIFVPIINAISAIPITISGLGLREVTFTTLFNLFFTRLGVTSNQAVSLSLLIFATMILVDLIGGIEYLRISKLPEKEKD